VGINSGPLILKMKVTEHNLVPKHLKLTKEKKKDLLEKYNITIKELPKILKEDPAIRHLKVIPGDVIKIVRASGTSGKSVYYRVVISG